MSFLEEKLLSQTKIGYQTKIVYQKLTQNKIQPFQNIKSLIVIKVISNPIQVTRNSKKEQNSNFFDHHEVISP